MIERYTDHAANERTFLAWVRTSLALTALGCVLAKLEWVLRLAGMSAVTAPPAGRLATWLGLGFIAAAVLSLGGAYLRFRQIRRAIAAPERQPLASAWLEAVLSLLIGALVLALAMVLWGAQGRC